MFGPLKMTSLGLYRPQRPNQNSLFYALQHDVPDITGGSVDKVHRNRAQAPVSKYLFGLISDIINCTDTYYTFLETFLHKKQLIYISRISLANIRTATIKNANLKVT